jgi:hypothetical protein
MSFDENLRGVSCRQGAKDSYVARGSVVLLEKRGRTRRVDTEARFLVATRRALQHHSLPTGSINNTAVVQSVYICCTGIRMREM